MTTLQKSWTIHAQAGKARPRVCFISNAIAHYRERFLELLRNRLDQEGIQLEVYYGREYQGHNIGGSIPWATEVPIRQVKSFSWLSVHKHCKDADLVIIPQVIKHLWIFPFIFRRGLGKQKVALWGHGKVFSAKPENHLASAVKNWLSKHCDWWFAYTELSARVVRDEIGFPSERITVANNAVDTKNLSRTREKLTPEEVNELKAKIGIKTEHVGIFVGGMYHSAHHTKRLAFLLAACHKIRAIIPDFEMIFVGGGPQQLLIEHAASETPWIHYVGVKKGTEAVPYWAMAKVCLNPGLIGLSILDSLALGVPTITCNLPYHSPEIEYLIPNVNGIMLKDESTPEKYASSVAELMLDQGRIEFLAINGKTKAAEVTNEAMVEHFTSGILKILNNKL